MKSSSDTSSSGDFSTKHVSKVLKKVRNKPYEFDTHTEILLKGVLKRNLTKQVPLVQNSNQNYSHSPFIVTDNSMSLVQAKTRQY